LQIGIDISGSPEPGIHLVGAVKPQDTIHVVYGRLTGKVLKPMMVAEGENCLRAREFNAPVFIDAILKAYWKGDLGVSTRKGKIGIDEEGKSIRLGAGGGIAQAVGFRPERFEENL
jgi:hypothetical protein